MGGRELIADLVGARTGLPLNPDTRTMRVLRRANSTRSVHFSRKPFYTGRFGDKSTRASQCKDIVIRQLRVRVASGVNYWKAVRRRWVHCEKAELMTPARKVCTGRIY